MSSLRFARAALRARPAAIRLPLGRRTYADAVADKIKLSLAMPHQVRPDCFVRWIGRNLFILLR